MKRSFNMRIMIKINKIIVAGILSLTFSAQCHAGSELEILINILHKNGTVDDAQYARLMEEIRMGTEKSEAEKKAVQAQLDKASDIEIKVDKGGLQVKSADGEFSTKIGGRVQADAAWYDEDGTQMGNGTEIRRARLYIQGKMFNDWGYKLQYDFVDSGKSGIKDAFLTYNGFDNIELKGGNFKDPFMLQQQTSSKFITFTERALPDAFSAGRHLGLMASTAHQRWTVSGGFFGDTVSTSSAGNDEGWGAAGRVTYAPINETSRVIHLGVAGNYRETGDGQSVRFKQQPETHISAVNIVDTGTILNVDNFFKVGAEFALVRGPFSFQSEYIWTTVNRDIASDLDFDGWYAEAAYFLTGESRHYKKGKFAGISPNSVVGRSGFGAWQLAARYSSINLNDADIRGGEADSVAIGLNWFATSTLRFSANYVRVLDIDQGMQDGEEPSLVQVRGQWAF